MSTNTAKLVSISQPQIKGVESAEDLIAYCARVSNPSNQLKSETAPKLLGYLIRHQHWSPFEMVSMTLEIQTTRDIARQILRHRSFSFQEFSQRYAVQTDFSFRDARLQDNKNRQNSLPNNDVGLQGNWEDVQRVVMSAAKNYYSWALEQGIAKEQARALLPEGLTNTTMYMAGSVRSWIHYIELRSGPETQKEHRDVALACRDVFLKELPTISEALEWDSQGS